MVKMFLSFIVGVLVLSSGANIAMASPIVTTASNGVVLTHIQAGGVGAATQEFVAMYNNSPDEVDISGWCLTNKNNIKFVCFIPSTAGQVMYLPAYSYAVAASESFSSTVPHHVFTRTYVPSNQSSGSIVGGGDTVSIVNHLEEIVDRHTWSMSLLAGTHFVRTGSGDQSVYIDTDSAPDWSVASVVNIPNDETELDQTIVDICPNIEGEQIVVPPGLEVSSTGECVEEVLIRLDITEVLPNAIGTDAGSEFIELYNPNDFSVQLSGYQLYVGPQLSDVYDFPTDLTIEPRQYMFFSNSTIPFNLLNSSSKVMLALRNGIVVGEMPAYETPKEGQSWALVDTVWRYVVSPTPGAINNVLASDVITESEHLTLQPCASNQYRSPETNRCRLITSATNTVTPCKDGQYRSEETHRCRNISSDTKTIVPCDANEERNPDTGRCRKVAVVAQPTPCKEGQERNPETNRCRNSAKMPSAEYGVLGAKTDGDGGWYVWAAVGGVLLLALAYGVWEWHVEIGKFLRKMYRYLTGFVRIHK